uniref:Agpsemzm n=1 Tax=Arundo donax TaxID=35708 RepID=A0A0A8XZ63_ARUDO
MAIERGGVELCQHIDFRYVAVQAIADRDINKPVVGTQWHCRLGALLRQGVQSSPGTTSKNDSKNTRAGVGVEAGLGALGVGHGARGEDERPPPLRR